MAASTPEESFAAVRDALLADPDASEGTGFGSIPGIKVGGKIAAMLLNGRLVVKLPAERCRELEAAGHAEPLRMGTRTMREWVTVDDSHSDWVGLAREAASFVRR